jgi:hypothetical protein
MNEYSNGILSNNAYIKIFHQNVQSLNNKKLHIEVLLTDQELDLDVFCITKHWLDEILWM